MGFPDFMHGLTIMPSVLVQNKVFFGPIYLFTSDQTIHLLSWIDLMLDYKLAEMFEIEINVREG